MTTPINQEMNTLTKRMMPPLSSLPSPVSRIVTIAAPLVVQWPNVKKPTEQRDTPPHLNTVSGKKTPSSYRLTPSPHSAFSPGEPIKNLTSPVSPVKEVLSPTLPTRAEPAPDLRKRGRPS